MHEASTPVSLLLHDGELRDVVGLMEDLGLRFRERRGSATHEDRIRSWDLVIGTPRQLLELDWSRVGQAPRSIAVVERDSKTLRAVLQRAGIDIVVRRPVHPASLRLLLLHTLYEGPEKRRARRVTVGSRVTLRLGLRRRPAVLADLSLSGCRLLCPDALEEDRKIKITVPSDATGGRSLTLTGTVLRCADAELPGVNAVAVTFGHHSAREADRLADLIVAHSSGPATLSERENPAPVGRPMPYAEPLPPPEPELRTPPADMPQPAEPIPLPPPDDDAAASRRSVPDPHDDSERRHAGRRVYDRRVIALGLEAARVLIGRDISMGGMRVDPNPGVSVGDRLQIAIHVRARENPLVVDAIVARDDGPAGLVLQFRDLSPEASDYLKRMIEFLPILSIREEGRVDAGLLISELLHHRPVPRS